MLVSEILSLKEMKLSIAQKVFNYNGGITIEGSSDCAHLMTGNDISR